MSIYKTKKTLNIKWVDYVPQEMNTFLYKYLTVEDQDRQ